MKVAFFVSALVAVGSAQVVGPEGYGRLGGIRAAMNPYANMGVRQSAFNPYANLGVRQPAFNPYAVGRSTAAFNPYANLVAPQQFRAAPQIYRAPQVVRAAPEVVYAEPEPVFNRRERRHSSNIVGGNDIMQYALLGGKTLLGDHASLMLAGMLTDVDLLAYQLLEKEGHLLNGKTKASVLAVLGGKQGIEGNTDLMAYSLMDDEGLFSKNNFAGQLMLTAGLGGNIQSHNGNLGGGLKNMFKLAMMGEDGDFGGGYLGKSYLSNRYGGF